MEKYGWRRHRAFGVRSGVSKNSTEFFCSSVCLAFLKGKAPSTPWQGCQLQSLRDGDITQNDQSTQSTARACLLPKGPARASVKASEPPRSGGWGGREPASTGPTSSWGAVVCEHNLEALPSTYNSCWDILTSQKYGSTECLLKVPRQ